MRNKLLQLVHIGKTQLGMDDETYRSLLSQQFYQNSAKNISYSELVKLVTILQQKGAAIHLPFGRSELSPMSKKIWALWKSMAKKGIIVDDSSSVLNNYIARILPNKQWNKLTMAEASQVIESLKQWQKRIEKMREEGNQ
ncbi:regulatory protein GemA [Glaesserella sp.]|uniref:regulatory protein GemA n=1 Tax=Glaesserella sp. TaxID=2094731 RepID=UPI0035A18B9A